MQSQRNGSRVQNDAPPGLDGQVVGFPVGQAVSMDPQTVVAGKNVGKEEAAPAVREGIRMLAGGGIFEVNRRAGNASASWREHMTGDGAAGIRLWQGGGCSDQQSGQNRVDDPTKAHILLIQAD